MAEKQREIYELMVDYANALRDGCIPDYLKSLSREEAKRITEADNFSDAAAVARLIHATHFSDDVVMPDVGLFMSRVDAEITARTKQARSGAPTRRSQGSRVSDAPL